MLVRDRLYINGALYNSDSELDLGTNNAEKPDSNAEQFSLNGGRRKHWGRGTLGGRG